MDLSYLNALSVLLGYFEKHVSNDNKMKAFVPKISIWQSNICIIVKIAF